MSKGKLIVLDGNDGSGKYTQSKMLADFLTKRGKKVLLLSFPRYDGTFFGKMLKELLLGKYGNFVDLNPHLASLPYAADRWSSRELILDTINSGGFVICDRYASANQIHQGGKIENKTDRKRFLSWLNKMEFDEFKIAKPDICIYLDVPLQISLELMNKKNKDTVENNHRYLNNSRKSAEWLIEQNPKNWAHINCSINGKIRSRKDIHEEIVKRLRL